MDHLEIIRMLDLKPLDVEGGYYRETYRSEGLISKEALPAFYDGQRCFGTAIYYLLAPGIYSAIHRVASDEIFHFYLGDPVEMLLLYHDGTGRELVLGPSITEGQRPQIIVPKNVWQGSCLREGGRFALLGTTVSPGFEYTDFIAGRRETLIRSYPGYSSTIMKLTREHP